MIKKIIKNYKIYDELREMIKNEENVLEKLPRKIYFIYNHIKLYKIIYNYIKIVIFYIIYI